MQQKTVMQATDRSAWPVNSSSCSSGRYALLRSLGGRNKCHTYACPSRTPFNPSFSGDAGKILEAFDEIREDGSRQGRG